jgi:hypothetical protein
MISDEVEVCRCEIYVVSVDDGVPGWADCDKEVG